MFLTLLSILSSVVTGVVLVQMLANPPTRSSPLLITSLSTGIGLGISSCIFVLWLYIAGSAGRGVAVVDLGLLALLSGLALWKKRGRSDQTQVSKIKRANLLAYAASFSAFGFCLIFATMIYGRTSRSLPHGAWDAWAIWNLHARFLFRGGAFWKEEFSNVIAWSHPDYPLLLPGAIARSWTYLGRESTLAPSLIAMCFTFGTVGTVFSALSTLRGRTQAFLGGAVLLASPFFLILGAWQYADVPLSFFIVAALALVALAEREHVDPHGLRVLAGMCAGLAVWTKNEGWVFALSLAFTQLVMTLAQVGQSRKVIRVLAFVAGFLPVAAVDLLFKVTVAPADYMFAPNQPSVLHRLANFPRYDPIAKAFWLGQLRVGGWRDNLIDVLVVYALLCGLYQGRNWGAIRFVLSITMAFTVTGYFFAYVITPEQNVQLQLSASLNRLLLQLWPSLVFLIFLIIRDPALSIPGHGSKGRRPVEESIA